MIPEMLLNSYPAKFGPGSKLCSWTFVKIAFAAKSNYSGSGNVHELLSNTNLLLNEKIGVHD
jgi:hypothetical protein